jgi:hypothetical protein
MAKIELLVDSRILFAKGSIVEVTEGEAKRLSLLGFAKRIEEIETPEITEEKLEVPEKAVKPKKGGRPKKEK